jgi:hypothetical protein
VSANFFCHPYRRIFRVFKNRVLRWIFGPKREEVAGGWRRQHNEELHNLYFPAVVVVIIKSRDSSVGIVLGYGLYDRGSRVRFPEGSGNFSLYHRVQNGSGAHAASYPMGTRGSFLGGKAAGA